MKRAKPRCAACGAACGSAVRRGSRHRAFVLSLGRVRSGFVCGACARMGWLLVFGGDTADAPRKRTRRDGKPGADARQLDWTSPARPVVTVEDAKQQLNPKRCATTIDLPVGKLRCEKPTEHSGLHTSRDGAYAWFTPSPLSSSLDVTREPAPSKKRASARARKSS